MMNPTDHDLIMQVLTKLDILQQAFSNHLSQHFTYMTLLISTLLAVGGTTTWHIINNHKNNKVK